MPTANAATTTSLNDLLSPLVQEALFVASERSIMRGLVRNYAMPMNRGKTAQVPIYPTVAAADIGENTDLENTVVSTDVANLTLKEVGVMTTLGDYAKNVSESDVVADLGKLFGESIARKMDQDLTALFDNFSTSVGGANVNISASAIAESVATLRASSVPMTDVACVVHPNIAYDLKANITNTFANPAAGELQNEAMRSGYVGTLFGVPVFESANMTYASGVAKGAVFHKDALGLAIMQDLKIETQRDASLRADEIVATAVYAVGELHDSYGIELHNLSSLYSA